MALVACSCATAHILLLMTALQRTLADMRLENHEEVESCSPTAARLCRRPSASSTAPGAACSAARSASVPADTRAAAAEAPRRG